jgi:hypothetical protein
MRTTLSLAVGAVAATLLFAAPAANAMTLPAPAGLADVGKAANPVEQVRLVCRNYWNGFRWRERCYRTGPYFGYYRPYRRYGYYGHRYW